MYLFLLPLGSAGSSMALSTECFPSTLIHSFIDITFLELVIFSQTRPSEVMIQRHR